MTLKEKIMKLQTYKMFEGEDTLYIARDDVLKLLEQEQCDKCVYSTKDGCCQYDDITETIPPFEQKNPGLPSVQTERTGKWIADVDRWGDVVTTVNGYKCSKCGCFNVDKDNYCPNCGAHMMEDSE